MPYLVATGHGVTLVSPTHDIVPQPQGGMVMPVQRNVAVTGAVHEIGGYVELNWQYIADAAVYMTLLTKFGLHNADYALVTLYCRDKRFVWARFNGTAVRPEAGKDVRWNGYRARDVTILVTRLAQI